MPIVAVITTATTQKKQVRFQLPSDVAAAGTTTTTTTTANTGPHLVESKGRQQQGCGTKGRPSKRRTAKKDPHGHNTWYTAKELKSFRTDIELTIKWMTTKGLIDDDRLKGRGDCSSSSSSSLPPPNRKKKADDTTAMMSLHLRMLYLEHYQHYPFCAQGVECRTPLGQWLKKKRRQDALRSVLALQQQQRSNKERSTQTTQMNNTDDHDDHDDHDKNTTALAHVYALSCQESCSLALDRGRRNDSSTDKDVTRSSSLLSGTKEEAQEQHWQKKKKREEQKKTTMLLRSSSITLAYQYHTFCDDMVSLLLLLNKSLIGGKE